MRLIDVDAIPWEVDGVGDIPVITKQEIDEMPTVDRWIPVSERLPEESGDYLCCVHEDWVEDFSDWSNPTIVGYDADCEAFGWWVDEYHPVSLGYLDSRFSECPVVAWMPLPEPYERKEE